MKTTPRELVSQLVLPVLVGLAGSLAAQQPFISYDGKSVGDRFGQSVSRAGDVNGDGVADSIVGAPLADASGIDSGAAYIFSGADGGLLWEFSGSAGDEFGTSVSGAGDVNGDGFADVIIGSPLSDENGFDAGSAVVVSGVDRTLIHRFNGQGGDYLGYSVSGAGDVNGDGYDDVIVGSPRDDNNGVNSGSAMVFSGIDGQLLFSIDGSALGASLGWSVSGAGDVNGDCFADVVVGAPYDDQGGWDAGAAYVLSGADGSVLVTMLGSVAGELLGKSVASAGDVDDDGTAEVVFGAPGVDTALVVAGDGSVVHTLSSAVAGSQFGASVGGGTDVNSDGFSEVIVGAPGPAGTTGSAMVFSGSTGSLLQTLSGKSIGGGFGISVSGLGDINGDDFSDVIIGAPEDINSGSLVTGTADVFVLPPVEHILSNEEAPAGTGAHFGARLNRAGDVNGDGIGDYMVGAPLEVGKFGRVRIYSGADHSVIHTLTGSQPDANFGIRLAPAGDIDNDGFGEVIVGAYHDDTIANDSGVATVFSGQTGFPMLTIFGLGFRSHLGTAVGGLGDVDGDGVGDVFVGAGLDNGERGSVSAYSGATGAVLYTVNGGQPGQWFGWDGAAVGDWNGDGFCDFAAGAPSGQVLPTPGTGFVRVHSGVDGALIKRFNGQFFQDRFGWVVKSAGDVNGDGVLDMIVGSDGFDGAGSDSGRARIYSGADLTVIRSHGGAAAQDFFGKGVGGAGDVNGDGFDDYLVGATGADPNGVITGGRAYLFSGKDGALLQTFDGTSPGDTVGTSLVGIGDTNGDGLSDLLISVHLSDTSGVDAGSVLLFETGPKSDPGSFGTYGAGCPDSNGSLPRIAFDGRPVGGETFQTQLRSAPANAAAVLGIDATPQSIPLAPIGLPDCVLLSLHFVSIPVTTDAMGKASFDLALPVGAPLATIYGQWVVVDAGASGVGVVLSNGGRITIGK